MKDNELMSLWKSYDQKLDNVLSINKEIIYDITRKRLNATVGVMRRPKMTMLTLGIPYTILLYSITFFAYKAGGIFVTLGFGAISAIMTAIIIAYCYQLYLINQISRSQEVVDVQKKIAELKISSFNTARLSVIQLPFWAVCWVSLDAVKSSPVWYGGINLMVFLGLTYLSYWLYKRLSVRNTYAKVSRFFLSGKEWDPIIKASEILEQLKEYDN